MTITIPSGQPNHRFMRYVRPPIKDDADHPPLYPLRPATRQLRLGIDVTTVQAPTGDLLPDYLLADYFARDEIEVWLLTPTDDEVPEAWTSTLPDAAMVRLGFSGVPDAWPTVLPMGVGIRAESKTRRTHGNESFFPVWQQLDARAAPTGAQPLTMTDRHRAAAYAAAAAMLRIDAVVTTTPTAGRSDVADNDVVASVTPDEAVALIGHYLRMTSNPDVDVQRGPLVGGGTWAVTQSAETIVRLYDTGVVSAMPFFARFQELAVEKGQTNSADAFSAMRIRLARASRALDHLLAALSNPINGKRSYDVIETASEAFDRQLLYLAAAFDIYGRLFPLLIDPTRTSSKQSLDAMGYIKDVVEKHYDDAELTGVRRLHPYATVCKVIRNRIHDGVLPVDQHPGRSYGNSTNTALNLDAMPELLPGHARVDPRLTQEHYDALGVWKSDPAGIGGSPTTVADLATVGATLMSAGLGLIEAFSKLILTNKPQTATTPSPLLGSRPVPEGWTEPEPASWLVRDRELFGWHPT